MEEGRMGFKAATTEPPPYANGEQTLKKEFLGLPCISEDPTVKKAAG